MSNALGRNSVEINQGNLRSVNVAQAGERTRLVLNLKRATNYKAQLQDRRWCWCSTRPPPRWRSRPLHLG